jgi:hypothetical protein
MVESCDQGTEMKCKCGKEIPATASSCPHCGRTTKLVLVLGVVLGIGVLILMAGSC